MKTLNDKLFDTIGLGTKGTKRAADECENICDDFAERFDEWLFDYTTFHYHRYNSHNDGRVRYHHYNNETLSIKELVQIFKDEIYSK